MQPFTRLDAIAAPLPMANVDTDKILAGRLLKTITRAGLGEKLFWSLRQDPGFVLNQAPWDRAGILITLDNFGCGSSREHAPWALLDFGIRCVIAPSIADIFYNNCFKNGILPIVLPSLQVEQLMEQVSDPMSARLVVDLMAQTVMPIGDACTSFAVDPIKRANLLKGVDDIDDTLSRGKEIAAFEARRGADVPWMTDGPIFCPKAA